MRREPTSPLGGPPPDRRGRCYHRSFRGYALVDHRCATRRRSGRVRRRERRCSSPARRTSSLRQSPARCSPGERRVTTRHDASRRRAPAAQSAASSRATGCGRRRGALRRRHARSASEVLHRSLPGPNSRMSRDTWSCPPVSGPHRRPKLVRRERHVDVSHAKRRERVHDGVGDCRRRGNRPCFAGALDA